MCGIDVASKYIEQLEAHEIYTHDEASLMPYCASVTLYPYLLKGTRPLGGSSGPPKHLKSFCGSFTNLLFLISAQFAGAVATVEFLMYFDYFAKKSFGDNYLDIHGKEISDFFQQVIYTANEPAVSRNYQSTFWNISIFDKYYFESLFGDFRFPDGTPPSYKSLDKLQRYFMKWFNKERERDILTFPVITAAMLSENDSPKDKEFADFVAEELSEGNAFFIYMSDSADSLSSCCRLKNEMEDNDFSYSLGAGGVSTGSKNVITINMNRLVQSSSVCLSEQIDLIHKYQLAYDAVLKDQFLSKDMLPLYNEGYINIDRQFLTIGINRY
jgi:ribonucleoside-triphosphate reductase